MLDDRTGSILAVWIVIFIWCDWYLADVRLCAGSD